MAEILHHPVSRALLLLNLALASLVLMRLVYPMASLSAVEFRSPEAAPAPQHIAEAVIASAPIEDTPAIADHPLFIESRRMPKEDTIPSGPGGGAETPIADALAGLTLSGIVMANGARVAMLKAASGPAPPALKEGDELRGWHVARIEADAVVLTANGDERRVAFAKPKQQGVTIGR